ncbi:MAG: leucine-rich repeat domain-containing protein, partial [Lachnospiraceae bacterium]|nr:leucine-rich repeat domain-containing protein [Lachnospiraceae bacterium]
MKKISIPSEAKIGGHSYSITEIYKECFRNNTNLKEVSVGNHISRIRDGAFASCGALKKVKLPAELIEIPAKAFMNCKKLT